MLDLKITYITNYNSNNSLSLYRFFSPSFSHKIMVSRLFLSPSLHSLLLLSSVLMLALIAYSEETKVFEECKKPFDCGVLRNLRYPFWGAGRRKYCGQEGFELICEDDQYPVLVSDSPDEFRLVKVDSDSKMMTFNLTNPRQYICPRHLANKTLNPSFLSQAGINLPSVALLYNCTNRYNMQYPIPIDGCEGWSDSYLTITNWSDEYPWQQCETTIKIPVPWSANDHPGVDTIAKSDLQILLEKEIDIRYDYGEGATKCPGCLSSQGACGSRMNDSHFICFCSDEDSPDVCPRREKGMNLGLKILIGVAASIGTALILVVGFLIWYRRKKKRQAPAFVSKSITSDPSSKADIEIGGNYNGVHLFTYEELEVATNNFDTARELGEGGFGTVYYGQLYDGRSVAVKRLYENNYKRVGQFMNEVHILTRLRHPHLVSLYGCTSRSSRELLLVYEYVPNGTVADHLHGERAKPGALPWTVRMNIAVETASALAYLHKSEIIHRDVKTNNILLDNNYWVKVADFGLSRLFPTDVTHVSTAPQGTPGYVDPEYHECYQLTSKSDVYSFGVVLIELISSMPAVDITRHRQEINLSNMAINKIQRDALNELVDPTLGFESDYAVRKMVIAVAELAFRCLQWAKDMRPPMDEVLEVLKEIQNAENSMEKGENLDILSDNVGLLKSAQLQLSPDTVTTNWTSSSTTPSASGKSLVDSGKEEILEITSDNVGLLRSTAPMQPSSGTVTTNTSTRPNARG